ncbi:MAG: desulfoferrodoxin family protein [Coriobacteriia bacterium]
MADAPVTSGVTLVEDFESADDFDKKHTPYIEFCGKDGVTSVCVTVGHEVPHPNEPGHFIDWIELQANGAPIARFDLSPAVTAPVVSIKVELEPGTTLRALEHCNLHGVFAYEVTV